ncbi:galactonate dehydratase [Rugosimonospora acidiphila]|uniref:Galactonate dehydratase n=1 Tax=Rugosimonospora acidiphila TaxID=556531 RepID=A0ABP9SD97_9ACTN
MRITAVDTFVLSNRHALVKVSTDEGVVGWGEHTLENWVRTVTAAVERMSEHLIGADPRGITGLWQTLARGGYYRGGPVLSSAVAGLDQALWDIKGRWLGVPIHELLGGPTRDHARVYAHANAPAGTGDPQRARAHVNAGIDLLKVAPQQRIEFLDRPEHLDGLLSDLTRLRAEVGPGVDIAIDLHGRFSLPLSRRLLPRLEALGVVFAEEPVRPEHSDLLGDLVRRSPVPIATGERLYSRAEFRRVLEAGVAIVQPDVCHAGGITEGFRIATLAETYDAQLAPHCPLGPVALAASLQLAFAVPNFYAQEQSLNLHLGPSPVTRILVDPRILVPVDGRIPRLTGPGLGIEVNEDAVRAAVDDGHLAPGSPVWHYPDGGFAEW